MGVLELGGLASALVAVVTLITKIVKLIASIQSLINRLELLQVEMEASKDERAFLMKQLFKHDGRLQELEYGLVEVSV